MLLRIALGFAFLCFCSGLCINLWVLVRAKAASDRLLALDTMTVNVIALLVLSGIGLGSRVFFEAAVLYAMFGFVSTVAFARFLKAELGR